jgi:hypothetical protein
LTAHTFTAVTATVYAENQENATQACEVITRAALGLALDGINVTIELSRHEVDCDCETGTEAGQ